jgi:2-polyprenyl-3-methyl-5-hydroxy-6-metoxy-1,4-benzoquinol methylase
MMQRFNQRSTELELMDQETIGFSEFHDCLQQLESINHLTLAYRPTLNWVSRWMKLPEPLVILDVGCGGGDMLRQIERRFSQNAASTPLLIGIDLNPHAKQSAQHLQSPCSIMYETANVFEFKHSQPIDLVICSLFTHHLSDLQIVDFLRWLDRNAERGWFINDLHRHFIPYYFIKAATRLLSKNRLIRNDAAVSVARSFTKSDWRHLLDRAGVTGRVNISWYFPFRICVSCEKL